MLSLAWKCKDSQGGGIQRAMDPRSNPFGFCQIQLAFSFSKWRLGNYKKAITMTKTITSFCWQLYVFLLLLLCPSTLNMLFVLLAAKAITRRWARNLDSERQDCAGTYREICAAFMGQPFHFFISEVDVVMGDLSHWLGWYFQNT